MLLAAAVLLVPAALGAQIRHLGDAWRWVPYDRQSGVPAGNPVAIVEAGGDRTWIVSDRGIAWFDGYVWHQARAKGDSLSVDRLRAPVGSPDGTLLGVIDGRVVRADTTGVSPENIPGLAAGVRVTSVLPVSDGLLIVTGNGVLLARHGTVRRATPEPGGLGPPWGGLPRLRQTPDGRDWLVADGLYEWTDSAWTRRLDRRPLVMTADGSGLIFSGRGADESMALYSWRAASGLQVEDASSLGQVRAIAADGQGDALVIYTTGIRLRGATGWQGIDQPPEPLERARSIAMRPNGDLWAWGSEGVYLFRGSSHRWSPLPANSPADEDADRINAMVRDPDGSLWLGTEAGLRIVDREGGTRRILQLGGRPLGPVTALASDTAGGIWVGSGAEFPGAWRYFHGQWRYYGAEEGLPAPRVHAIAPDSSGNLWFLGLGTAASPDPGAFMWNGHTFVRWDTARGLPSNRVYAFAEGADGGRWFGTSEGLSHWYRGAWTHWRTSENPAIGRVYTIQPDLAGGAWFGQRFVPAGLGHVDVRGQIAFTSIGEGESENEIAEIRRDGTGRLWMSTHGGLAIWNDGNIALLGRHAGLRNSVTWPILPEEDHILVGTAGDGVQVLHLEETGEPAPRVSLVGPIIDPRHAVFQWTAHAWQGLQAPDDIRTRYRIDRGSWSGWSTSREAGILNLAPGRHRFEVQALGLFGRVARPNAAVTFEVPPPFYLHPAFLATMGVLLAGLAGFAAFYGARRRQHAIALRQLNARLAHDIEQRQLAEAALLESERFSTHVANSVPSILCVYDRADGRIVYINEAVEQILGISMQAAMALGSYRDLVHPADQDHVEEVARQIAVAPDRAIVASECRLRTASGDPRTFAVRTTVFRRNARGEPDQALAVAQDVTEQRSLQEQLLQAQKMETVGRLAGGIAHDFNNLLTVMVGYADLLREELPEESPLRADVDEIRQASDRARGLTTQLLAFARKQVTTPRIVQVNDLINSISKLVHRMLGEETELRLDLSGGLSPVRLDPSQFEQVLLNLAVNARDAMPGGGTLTITTSAQEEYVRLGVADTGVGMHADVLRQAFEPFFTTKEVGKGTGLGLSTCYGIIRQAGGDITAESVPGEGTTFTILLPMMRDTPLDNALTATEAEPAEGTETILLVEDEAQVRELSLRALSSHGYDVIHAPDGKAALALMDARETPVDLLVTDMIMPGMGGEALWKSLRARWPDLRAVFVSGYAEHAADLAANPDAPPLLPKPFTRKQLLGIVRSILDRP